MKEKHQEKKKNFQAIQKYKDKLKDGKGEEVDFDKVFNKERNVGQKGVKKNKPHVLDMMRHKRDQQNKQKRNKGIKKGIKRPGKIARKHGKKR